MVGSRPATLTVLVITLRSYCCFNKLTREKRNWCFPEQATLAQQVGVGISTIYRELKRPIAAEFIRREAQYRYDAQKRKKVRTKFSQYYRWWRSDAPQRLLGRDDFRLLTVTKSPERMATLRRTAGEATAAALGRNFREPWRGFLFAHEGNFDITRPRSITERIFHFATNEPPISLLE